MTNCVLRCVLRYRFVLWGIWTVMAALPCAVDAGIAGKARPSQSVSEKAKPPDRRSDRRPNIVVIVSDDHRWDLMSCTGNPYMKTPQLDRLAREGCLFDNAFAVCGVCSPSRAAILTGKYAHQCRAPYIIWKNNTFLANETPFPARLHAAGYHTAHFGKWHLGEGQLPKPGYDHWAGFEWLGQYTDTKVWINGKMKQFEGYSDDILSTLAAAYIEERAKTSQPFCLYLGLKAPHLHFKYPPRLEHALDGIEIPKPDSYDEDYDRTGKAPCLKGNVIRIETFRGGLPLFKNSWEKYIKSYYRSALSIDDSVGRVMRALDEAGVADDTILIYTSDQGYTLGEHGMTEKHYAYEQVMRVPMLVRYPRRIKPGSHPKEMVLTLDIAPTLLDLCGQQIPSEMVGQSWRRLFEADRHPVKEWRDDFLFEFASANPKLPAQLAVRTDRYKLITYQHFPDRELYDLQEDPREMRNVADRLEYAPVLADMRNRLDRLIRETGWVKRTERPVTSCYVLGPVAADDEGRVRQALRTRPFDAGARFKADGKNLAWHKLTAGENHRLNVASILGKGLGHIGFIAIPLVRLTEQDPYVTLKFKPFGPRGATKMYLAGQPSWEGRPRFPVCNPPLDKRKNTLLVRITTTRQGDLQLTMNAPLDSIKLP